MIIKKFNNGKLSLSLEKCDIENGEVDENVYHDEMFMEDLYLESVFDEWYLLDYNTSRAYYIGSHRVQNPLKWMLDILKECYEENRVYHLRPEDEGDSKIIINKSLDGE